MENDNFWQKHSLADGLQVYKVKLGGGGETDFFLCIWSFHQ